MKNKIIPVLMYHELEGEYISRNATFSMTPSYFMPKQKFDEQLRTLSENGYKSITFEDIPNVSDDVKYVVITFDDGWVGNYLYALPILRKYGFKATFFITIEYIGSKGYMNWDEVEKLAKEGMSIQSHAMTHHPLQMLKSSEIVDAFMGSKQEIEKRLNRKVIAFSFPHGSYDKSIVKMAGKAGYKVVCCSDLKSLYDTRSVEEPLVVGRITMTSNMPSDRFSKLVECDRYEISKGKLIKGSKNLLKKIIGIDNYRKLYRKYLNIEEPF